ncbi:hypothetical protein IJT10_01565 [bacterium]|nr:hypothetical protein [bacterium]
MITHNRYASGDSKNDRLDLSPSLYRLLTEVHESRGKFEVLSYIDPAVMQELPDATIMKNLQLLCNTLQMPVLSEEEEEEFIDEFLREGRDNFKSSFEHIDLNSCDNFNGKKMTKLGRSLFIKNLARSLMLLESADEFKLSVDSILSVYRSLFLGNVEEADCWTSRDSVRYYVVTANKESDEFHSIVKAVDSSQINGNLDILKQCETYEGDFASELESICENYNEDVNGIEPLLLIPRFVASLLRMSPFKSAVEMFLTAELLLMILLDKSGYKVYRYVSYYLISKVMSRDDGVDTFLTAFRQYLFGNDTPIIMYALRHLSLAYEHFFYRLLPLGGRDRKAKCIRALFKDGDINLNKSEIHEICYEISVPTIESVLGRLCKDKVLKKVGKGRTTSYQLV